MTGVPERSVVGPVLISSLRIWIVGQSEPSGGASCPKSGGSD